MPDVPSYSNVEGDVAAQGMNSTDVSDVTAKENIKPRVTSRMGEKADRKKSVRNHEGGPATGRDHSL